ncbi:MAG: Holliday junction branch migration protein RuvA [Syntrophales bacterium]|nr:Holliday junction branch migration protein RuvA [Syntrophales bacterium]NLN59694.1 Holliday junction branch migration protein RuvA [Deltaproteobacteria bacterium]
MIARLNGTLIQKRPASLVVEAMGVGYEVFVPLSTFYELPDIGQDVVLHVHTQVRQDAISLFGFISEREKDIFQILISVNGIGPKLAMNILSGTDPAELLRLISRGDLNRLIRIPGVGKKMAERIIFDLRDKKITDTPDAPGGDKPRTADLDAVREDALSALMNLGYRNQMVNDALDRVIQEADAEQISLDVILKKTLKLLAN